jgi:hypothetical protein
MILCRSYSLKDARLETEQAAIEFRGRAEIFWVQLMLRPRKMSHEAHKKFAPGFWGGFAPAHSSVKISPMSLTAPPVRKRRHFSPIAGS